MTVDELEITGALRVAVSSTVFRTSLVVREPGDSAVRVHLREVDSAVQAARKVRNVDVKGELPVKHFEELVRGVGVHEVHTRPDVRASDEFERKGVASGGDTVRS